MWDEPKAQVNDSKLDGSLLDTTNGVGWYRQQECDHGSRDHLRIV